MTDRVPLEEALKRAYYYREDGTWRVLSDPSDDWECWHDVAKAARAAITQADIDEYQSRWNALTETQRSSNANGPDEKADPGAAL